jgi:hypothetical protein
MRDVKRQPFFTIHCCLLDKRCDVARLHINLASWHVAVALWPSSTLQLFDSKTGRYGERWGWVSITKH